MAHAFLGVKKSLSNRHWIGPSIRNERIASRLVQDYNMSLLTALMLAKRNIDTNMLKSYLSPKIRDLMPDPYKICSSLTADVLG